MRKERGREREGEEWKKEREREGEKEGGGEMLYKSTLHLSKLQLLAMRI